MRAFGLLRRASRAMFVSALALMAAEPAFAFAINVEENGATTQVPLYRSTNGLVIGSAEVLATLQAGQLQVQSAPATDGAGALAAITRFAATAGQDPDGRLLIWVAGLPDLTPEALAAALRTASSRHILVVQDGCTSLPQAAAPEPEDQLTREALLPGRQLLARCGPPSPTFAATFLEAVRQGSAADDNGDRFVTGRELAARLIDKAADGEQFALVALDPAFPGDVVFNAGGYYSTAQGRTETSTPSGGSVPMLSVAPPPPPAAPPPPPPPEMEAPSTVQSYVAQDAAGYAVQRALRPLAPGTAMPVPLPYPGPLVAQPQDSETYRDVTSNPVRIAREEPVSTFSIDVDTASYANVRRFLRDGQVPPADAVRIEELINYFDYDYPVPEDRSRPFSVTTDVAPTPWNPKTRLLQIGIQGHDIVAAERPAANLTFLLDVSGSMGQPDKLPLLQQALRLMVRELRPQDHVAIVVYAGQAGAVLEPTSGKDKGRIMRAIDGLSAGGSTAGGQGIELAYRLARENFDPKAVNRVILGTDGDFNVGITDPKRLEDFVAGQRKTGIYLTIMGFGQGNLNDALVQTLAQAGNGNAAYIDGLSEARKVLVQDMASTVFPIADDVKIQVEFNPAVVAEYRLIGYETRLLNREDFNNDAVDAGEVGANASVTALYEVTPVGSGATLVDPLRYGSETAPAGDPSGEMAFVKVRYKLPGEASSTLITQPVKPDINPEPGADIRFAAAVAGFGQLLRGDAYTKALTYDDVVRLAQGARGADPEGWRGEFIQLVRLAESNQPVR